MAGERPPSDKNLVQCEITKQWLPAQEIVEIQGHKVCGAYGIVNIIMALVDRDKQRALHDRLAGTRVIRVG